MKITTSKSLSRQQWEKSFYQTTTKWRMQERSSAREIGSIPCENGDPGCTGRVKWGNFIKAQFRQN